MSLLFCMNKTSYKIAQTRESDALFLKADNLGYVLVIKVKYLLVMHMHVTDVPVKRDTKYFFLG